MFNQILYTVLRPIRYTLHAALFMQNKANLRNAQINITPLLTKEYENIRLYRRDENKPNL
jgi:hypothetical protein